MNRKYIRNEDQCYIEMEAAGGNEYEYRMLEENRMTSLLPMEIQEDGQKRILRYRVDHQKPFWITSEKMWISYRQLYSIVDGLLKTIEQIKKYMLFPDNLVLDMNCIFWEISRCELHLIYLPGYKKDIIRQMADFIEKLLGKLDHRDTKGIYFAYGLHKILVEDHPGTEEIRRFMDGKQLTEEEVYIEEKEVCGKKAIGKKGFGRKTAEFTDGKDTDKKERLRRWILIIGGIAGILFMGMIGYLLFIIYMDGITEWRRNFLVGFGVLFAADGIYVISHCRKEHEEKELKDLIDGADRSGYREYEERAIISQRSEHLSGSLIKETTLLERADSGNHKDYPMLVLLDMESQVKIRINKTPFVIGKYRTGTDYCLDQKQISRFHVSIIEKDGDYFIKDLHSTNGTFINRRKINFGEEQEIKDGDQITLADLNFLFENKKKESPQKI